MSCLRRCRYQYPECCEDETSFKECIAYIAFTSLALGGSIAGFTWGLPDDDVHKQFDQGTIGLVAGGLVGAFSIKAWEKLGSCIYRSCYSRPRHTNYNGSFWDLPSPSINNLEWQPQQPLLDSTSINIHDDGDEEEQKSQLKK